MRIAFACPHPPDQKTAFSGTPYYMSRSIRMESEYFEYIQCPNYNLGLVKRGGAEGRSEIERIGHFLSERLLEVDVDVIICLESSMIPFLRTYKPVILWHDSTWFSLMQIDFEEFKSQYPLLYEWDQLTFERCDLIAFAADWVREQTLTNYKVAPEKVDVIPFGANVDPVSQEAVKDFITGRENSPCRLTFIGVDWLGKGLPLAYEVMTKLSAIGLSTELNVIGCGVPAIGPKRKFKHYVGYQPFTDTERFQLRFNRDANVNKYGFLNKEDARQSRQFSEILIRTHFLLHPTNFDCFGIVMAEANAYGVPVLTTDNYGPRTIIKNGVNGHRYEQSVFVESASAFIQSHMNNWDAYRSLGLSSFLEYQNRLNWTTSVRRLMELISDLLMR
jgi:glycosyltransferase involved in cell wall biosynthesis